MGGGGGVIERGRENNSAPFCVGDDTNQPEALSL